jgi:hypothetical protein
MAQGRQARASADLPSALRSFTEADELMRVPTTGYEVARTLKEMGRLVEASAAVTRTEALPVEADEPEAFAKARQSLKELEAELAARTPTLRVVVTAATGKQAKLTLDGKQLVTAEAAVGFHVDPGRHVATAEVGGAVQRRVVELVESGTAEVAFDFGAPVTEGEPKHYQRAARSNATTYAVYGLTGLSAVGLGAGVGLALYGNHQRNVLKRDCAPDCSAQQVTSVRTAYVAANISGAIGIASGVAALALYFTHRDSDRHREERAGSWSLGPAPEGATGASLAGKF